MLNAFGYLLYFKICWHNRPGPKRDWVKAGRGWGLGQEFLDGRGPRLVSLDYA